ncbi:MAG: copper amine oxidase N-terminal domain-containing protein [Tissierellia bacterium]|nr:copper amine oxidase N-terminal domain-containing protein [Tissierellia bacterium]
MKTKAKVLCLLAFILCFSSVMFVYADEKTTTTGNRNSVSGSGMGIAEDLGVSEETQKGQEDLSNKNGSSINSSNNEESGNGDTLRDLKRFMDKTCISLKEQLSDIETSCKELENQYQTALKLQNEGEAQLLQEQLQLKEQEKGECEQELKQVREQLRETVRTSYTEEEMARIRDVEMKLKQDFPDDRILPVENIIPIGFTLKFDTPPVIRNGRTLISVRALSEGMGAAVTWNGEDSTVIIEKEGVKIQLQLRNRLVYVNGNEMTLDIPPETINSRTVVPLRFILEQLGCDVDWDNDIIEIISAKL